MSHWNLKWQEITFQKIFFKTIKNGILYVLGSLFFEQLFNIQDDLICCDIEIAFRDTRLLYFLLKKSEILNDAENENLLLSIDEIDWIMSEVPINRQNSVLHRQGIHWRIQDTLEEIINNHKNDLEKLKNLYANNFAERILHDRQYCEYISFMFLNIYRESGYPKYVQKGEIIFEGVKREKWPSWVKPTLLSRERGLCAKCNTSFLDLLADTHIDHIVPLNQGGCNDLVNLQILCTKCNLEKSDRIDLVKSSIPKYLDWKKW